MKTFSLFAGNTSPGRPATMQLPTPPPGKTLYAVAMTSCTISNDAGRLSVTNAYFQISGNTLYLKTDNSNGNGWSSGGTNISVNGVLIYK